MGWTHERARVAALTRSRTPDDPELQQARQNMRAERLAEHVQKIVRTIPPLTAEQRARIAALLRDVPAHTGGGDQAP